MNNTKSGQNSLPPTKSTTTQHVTRSTTTNKYSVGKNKISNIITNNKDTQITINSNDTAQVTINGNDTTQVPPNQSKNMDQVTDESNLAPDTDL